MALDFQVFFRRKNAMGRNAGYAEIPSGLIRAIRFMHDKYAAHDGVKCTMVGIGAW